MTAANAACSDWCKVTDYRVKYAYVDAKRITHRLVRNPHYCNDKVQLNGWCRVPVEHAQHKRKFFAALEEDVKANGYRNPIVIYALPEGLHLSFGASRLRVAQKLGIEVPCIINDYTGEFAEEVDVTGETVPEFFTDPPRRWKFGQYGFNYHYSCERNRRETYDPQGMVWMQGVDNADEIIGNEFPWILEGKPDD